MNKIKSQKLRKMTPSQFRSYMINLIGKTSKFDLLFTLKNNLTEEDKNNYINLLVKEGLVEE